MNKILMFLLLAVSLSFAESNSKESSAIFVQDLNRDTITEINNKEFREPLSQALINFMNEPEELDTKVVSLKIPAILNTDVGCGGFQASIGDVLGVVAAQLEKIAEQIPQWIIQEALGVPLDSPAEMIRIVVDFMIEGYCYAEIVGVQAVQTAAEATLDFTARLFETHETENEVAAGTTNMNGNIDNPANAHTGQEVLTPGTNQTAGAQSTAESTEQTTKELNEKIAECIKQKQAFVAEILDMKVSKFLPLAHDKKNLMKSACEIIKEKGKKTNLNDKFDIPDKIYSPLFFKKTPKEDLLELDGGMLMVKRDTEMGAVNAWINDNKVNAFFENDLELLNYSNNEHSISNRRVMDSATAILNGLTSCINNPDGTTCESYESNQNFFLRFSEDSDELKGLQTKLIRKKNTCSLIEAQRFDLNVLNNFFNAITEVDIGQKVSQEESKFIFDYYVMDTFCNRQFNKEISQLDIYLTQKIENEYKAVAKDYSAILSQLTAFKTLNASWVYKEDATTKTGLSKICAYSEKDTGEAGSDIYYLTDKNEIKKASSIDELIDKYEIEIENKPSVFPVLMEPSTYDCVYDLSSKEFQEHYDDYLKGEEKQVVSKKPLTKKKYSDKMLKQRELDLQSANQLNGYLAELRGEVLLNILKDKKDKIILKLKF